MRWVALSILFSVLCPLIARSQSQSTGDGKADFEQLIEDMVPVASGTDDAEVLTEMLMTKYLNILDLNKATADRLRGLMILDEAAIEAILRHRELTGPYISVYELQTLPELTPSMLQKLLPFVEVKSRMAGDNRTLPQRMMAEKNHFLLTRFSASAPLRSGFSRPEGDAMRFEGAPYNRYLRYRLARSGDFSVGFTAESDEGEKWSPSPDFFSVHALVTPGKTFTKLVLGDYTAQFGQGLVFAGGFYMGKGAETILSLRRSDIGLLPYTSVSEAGFLRGAAFTASRGRWSVTPMISGTQNDAGSFGTDSSGALAANSFNFSGLHRNQRELQRKHSVDVQTGGINFSYLSKDKNLQLGSNAISSGFNPPVDFTSPLYGGNRFAGNRLSVASIYFSKSFSNIQVFGEAARSSAGRSAWMAGTVWSFGKYFDWAVLARSYQPGFRSLYGAGFAESSMPENEAGVYTGLKFKPSKKWLFSAYTDIFYFPWLRFRAYAPGYGTEYMAHAEYMPNKFTRLFLRMRVEEKPLNPGSAYNSDVISRPQERKKLNGMFHIQTKAARTVTLKSRISWSNIGHAGYLSQGMAVVNDAEIKTGRFDFSFRYAVFDTDDYENRQYHYEKDVLYAFSLPGYYGRGSRMAVVIHVKISPKIDAWLKVAETFRNDVEFTGSGVDKREGAALREIKLMSRVYF